MAPVVIPGAIPEARAAGSPLPSDYYCGPSGYGVVGYDYGARATRCLIQLSNPGTTPTLWTKPSEMGSFTAWLIGAGGGGGGTASGNPDPGRWGMNGTIDDLQADSDVTGLNYYTGVQGLGGQNAPATAGDGGDTWAALDPSGSNNTAPGGDGGPNSSYSSPSPYCNPAPGPWGGNWGGGGCGRAGSVGDPGQYGRIIISYVPGAPSPPSAVTATNDDTPGVVQVSWTASASVLARQYLVSADTSDPGGVDQTCLAKPSTASGLVPTSCSFSGATSLTVGATYTVSVKPQTALGTDGNVASTTVQVTGAPQNTDEPTLSGTAALTTPTAQVLTGTPGTWSTFSFTVDDTEYQWQYADDSVSGPWTSAPGDSTSLDYTISSASLAGKYVRLGVRLENLYGWSDWAYSMPSAQVTSAPVFTAESPPGAADDSRPYVGYTFAASGYRITYTEDDSGLTGLPPGMSIDSSTGVLSGTPSQEGVFTYRVVASNDSGDDTTPTLTLTVSDGVPAQLVIQRQPVGNMPSRTALSVQPIIQVVDDSGYPVSDDTIITVTANGTAAVLGADDTASSGRIGVATFSNITLGGLVDDTYTLTFALGALTVTSDEIQVLPGAPTNLQIRTAPVAAAQAGLEMTTQPVIEVRDADTNLVTTDDTTRVILTPATGGFVGPTQDDTASAVAAAGVATFSGVRFGGPTGVSVVLTFSATGLTSATASVTSTASGPSYKLVVIQEATSPSASGLAFLTQPWVMRQDMAGNPVSTEPQATVTATLVEESQPYDVLVGTTTALAATDDSIARFADLGISGLAGQTYTIRFTSPGLVSADDTVVPSVGAAARLSLTAPGAEPPGNASYDDTAFDPQPKVQIVDSGNNPVSVNGVEVTASIVSGTGTLVDDTALSDANGLATFTNLRLDALTGTYVLRFSASGYASVDDTVRMLRGAQTVTLSSIGAKTFGVAPFPISAVTSSGLTATFSTTTPSVCSVTGNASAIDDTTGARVTLLGAGSCTIFASQAGDAGFEPAVDDSETFTVLKAQQAPLTLIAPATAQAGESVNLRTVGGSGSGAVTFDDTDVSGICSLNSSSGLVTFTGSGSCDFTATKSGGANYDDTTSAAVTITIPGGAGGLSGQTVAFTSSVPASPIDDDTYVAVASSTSGLSVTIGVQAGSPACTATTGTSPVTVTFTGAGTCVLEATQAGDARFDAAASVTQTILVYADAADAAAGLKNQSVTFVAPSAQRIGKPDFRLTATATSGLAVTFTAPTPAACTITSGGIVHLVAPGPCTVVADQAGNSAYAPADSVTRTFTVTAGVPSAPRILSSSVGTGAATLNFAAPDDTGGSPIIAYSIFATPTSGGATVSTTDCTASPCTITGLVDDSTYTIAIAAINAAGTGPYSVSTPELTPKSCSVCVGAPGGTPGGPGGPTGDRLDDTTIVLSWSQPGDLGDDTFVSYDIYYRPAGSAWPNSPQESITNINTTSTTITGLTAGVVYDFLIVVVTDANPRVTPPSSTDPTAKPITVGTPTAPMPPNDLAALYVTDTSIVVSWAYPPSNGGSPITGYSVSFSPSATCSTPVLDDTTRTAACTASGLITGTTYTISATATNAIGTSVGSDPITYTTPGDPPDPGPTPGPTPGPGPDPYPPAPPVPPGPQPVPSPAPQPGDTEGTEDGRPISTTPGANAGGDQFTVTGPNFGLTVTAYNGNARVPLGAGPVLRSVPGGRIVVEGATYSYSSDVSIYLYADGGERLQARAAVAVASATGKTNSSGRFIVTLTVPIDAAIGSYTLQVNGYSLQATTRSVNIGVIVEPAPWMKAKMKKMRGKAVKVTAQGLTGEIPAGAAVVPMIRFKGKMDWVQGLSRPKVKKDGTFTWKRKFNRTAWIYFFWTDPSTMKPTQVRSNTLEYKKPLRT